MRRRTKKTINYLAAAGVFLLGIAALPMLASLPNVREYFRANEAWLVPAATLLQAVVIAFSVFYARLLYFATQETTAKRTTLDRIFEEHVDGEVVAYRKLYLELRDELKSDFSLFADSTSDLDEYIIAEQKKHPGLTRESSTKAWRDSQTAVKAVMNRYEAFAVGINAKAINEEMYKKWWKTSLIRDWYTLYPLIAKLRRKIPRAYVEFQTLAQRWEKQDIRENQNLQDMMRE